MVLTDYFGRFYKYLVKYISLQNQRYIEIFFITRHIKLKNKYLTIFLTLGSPNSNHIDKLSFIFYILNHRTLEFVLLRYSIQGYCNIKYFEPIELLIFDNIKFLF